MHLTSPGYGSSSGYHTIDFTITIYHEPIEVVYIPPVIEPIIEIPEVYLPFIPFPTMDCWIVNITTKAFMTIECSHNISINLDYFNYIESNANNSNSFHENVLLNYSYYFDLTRLV